MKCRTRLGQRSGFSLIELLVVMLIISILAMALWPTIRERIVQAQYTANAIPVVGLLQTKAEMYDYERGFLPGLAMDGRVPADPPGNTEIEAGSMVQGWIQNAANPLLYDRAVYDEDGTSTATESADHFGLRLSTGYEQLSTRLGRPAHIQYLAPVGGYQSVTRAYAIGSFGNGDGLAAGTGYAVLHINNAHPEVQQVLIAKWERFRPFVETPQLYFRVGGEPSDQDPHVWIPAAGQIQAESEDDWNILTGLLKAGGWDF